MEEIKSVKVDNWGVFFLQKLQNFFNKTDYCDLTLQFNDNSQLKVHRLVLSACTDYFNVLEQTCEMIEDVLIMPLELQADVVVPIVNFMYTGTLEFELKMYGKLLKTAKDMNMTVLLKLLEAHRRTMEGNHPKPNRSPQKPYRRLIPVSGTGPGPGRPRNSASLVRTQNTGTSAQTVQRRTHGSNNSVQYKTLQIKPVNPNYFPGKNLPESAQILAKYPHSKTPVKGPSRFDCNEDNLPPETFEPSFDSISYESKPLICKEEPEAYDYDNLIRKHETYASPFEQLRRGYTNNNNKRPSSSVSSYESPPEKKPNIQDVKEYAEQQRMRKQIAQEFDDDNEFDEVLDDEFQNDDDDDDYVPPASVEKQIKKQQAFTEKAATYKKQPKQHAESSQRPTIVVKDSSSANVNHAKIISEVLRKYPHLVKNNKNIKLKIMPQTSGKQSQQKIIVKTEAPDPVEKEVADIKIESSPSTKPITTLAITKASPPPPPPSASAAQPRRIDSKTMHSLIALGAENRTGPWLCLRCGVNGRPISIPSYRGFRRHLINTHKEKIDSRLCEHCGWRSSNNRELYHHMYADHTIKPPPNYVFPKCSLCNQVLLDNGMLEKHMVELHDVKKENEECMYCNKTFARNIDLYSHMKTQHRDRAREDGVLDFSDDDTMESDAESQSQTQNESSQQKIKILSDISLPKNPIIESNTGVAETVELNSIGTGIAASLGLLDTNPTGEETPASSQQTEANAAEEEPRFVNVDGSEMELTPAQRREIMSQIGQQHDGLVMVLNEEELGHETAEPSARNVTGDNMLLVYSHEGVDMETIVTTDKVSEDQIEANEAESKKNLDEDSADVASSPKSEKSESEDVKKEKPNDEEKSPTKPNDSLDLKMKLLTDWADEEEEDEEDEEEEGPHEKEDEIEKSSEKSEKEADREDVKTPSNDTTDAEILFETIATVEIPTEKKTTATEEPEEKEDTTEKQLKEMEKAIKPQTPRNSQEKSQPGSPMEVDSNEKTDPLKEDEKDNDPEEPEDDTKPEEASSDVEEKEEEEQNKEEEQNEEEETKKKAETGSSKVDEEKPVSEKEPGKKNAEGDLILTKADIKNLIADWGDEDDENEI